MHKVIKAMFLSAVCGTLMGQTPMVNACEVDRPLTMAQALARLHTHRELQWTLHGMAAFARNPMEVGPLIDNGLGGIFNIDTEIAPQLAVNRDVCGVDTSPTIREAVVCTVPPGERGNHDPFAIGMSTQGRALLAVRMGNPNGLKVMYWTQQHGNEVASTEAAIEIIGRLAFGRQAWVREVLNRLDMVFVVRANPDGGEPGDACFLPPYPIAEPVTAETCGITRYTVDSAAGGGFGENTEAGFRGVVGRGYDMNRYHYPDLSGPIRPQETQALIAAVLAFSPEYIVDLHADLLKSACTVDSDSIISNPFLGGLPSASCQVDADDEQVGPVAVDEVVNFGFFSSIASSNDPSLLHNYTLGANLIHAVENRGLGLGARFSQVALDVGVIEQTHPYNTLDIDLVGWEVGLIPGVSLGVLSVANGEPSVGITTDVGFDPGKLSRAITINSVALVESLKNFARFARRDPVDDANYCSIRTAQGILAQLPALTFGPNPYQEVPVMVPFLPGVVPVQYFDACQ